MREILYNQERIHSKYDYILEVGLAVICLLYAYAKVAFHDPIEPIEPIFALGVIYFFWRGRGIRSSLPVIFLFLCVFYTYIAWKIGYTLHPSLFVDRPELHWLARLFIFIILAFYTMGSAKRSYVLLAVGAAGMITALWSVGGGFSEILAGLSGTRVGFGLEDAQHTGMIFGTILIGSLCFLQKAVSNKKIILSIVLTLLMVFSALIIYMVQTRGTIVGLFATLCAYLVVLLIKTNKVKIRTLLIGSILSMFVVASLGYMAYKRGVADFTRIENLWNGNLVSIANTSAGARLNAWDAGFEWLAKSPFIGWGTRGADVMANHTERLEGTLPSTFGHMHSSYMDFLVRFGLIGTAIFGYLLFWIIKNTQRVKKAALIPEDIYNFLFFSLIFLLTVNLFESLLFFWPDPPVFNIVVAIAVGYIWKGKQQITI